MNKDARRGPPCSSQAASSRPDAVRSRTICGASIGMDSRQRHLISGQRLAARSGATFDAHAPASGRLLGRWPRAGPHEWSAARAAGQAAAGAWRANPGASRHATLARALRGSAPSQAAFDELAGNSGRARAALVAQHHAVRLRLLELLEQEPPADRADAPTDWALVAPHWSAGLEGLLLELVAALRAGQACIVAPDPRLCAAGDCLLPLAECLPAGLVSILHGLDRSLAGVEAAWRRPDGRVVRAPRGAAAALHAQRVVEAVFGAERGACGAREGVPNVVLVADEDHGAYSAALLEAFEKHPDRRAPFALAAKEGAAVRAELEAEASVAGATLVPPATGAHGRVAFHLPLRSRLASRPPAGPIVLVVRV